MKKLIVPKDGQLVEVWFRNGDGVERKALAHYSISRGFILADSEIVEGGVATRWKATNPNSKTYETDTRPD